MCNPPYGERLLDVERARVLYKVMGKAFPSNRECPSYVISPDDEFEQCFGKKADKKRKLYNGMMKCNLFQYFK
jgi:putative N6-adenine-specific DNA methylase